MSSQPNNPLHGIKLQMIIEYLVENLGWEEMGKRVNIRCFTHDPSIKSSLKFLRRTQWARDKVEELYLGTIGEGKKKKPEKPHKKRKPFKKPPEYDDGLDW